MPNLQRWTPEQIQTLREMKAAGAKLAEIAVALDTTLERVKNRMCWESKDADQRLQRRKQNNLRKKKREYWTPQHLEAARCLVQRGASDEECLATVGRSFHACYVKIDREVRAPRARTTPQPIVAPDVIDQARARICAPRSLTAWICGDPAPGCSALDQRGNCA